MIQFPTSPAFAGLPRGRIVHNNPKSPKVTVYRPSLPRIEDVRQQAGVLAGPVAF